MRFLVGKLDDLVLDRRTVSWSDALNLPTVHRRTMHVLTDDSVCLRRGERDVTRHLLVMVRHPPGAEAEWRGIVVAGLHLELRPVNAASIETRRRPGLQTAAAQSKRLQRFTQQDRVWFPAASGGILLLAAMDKPVQKCSSGDDDRLRRDKASVTKANTKNSRFAFRFSLFARGTHTNGVILSGARFGRSRRICGSCMGC